MMPRAPRAASFLRKSSQAGSKASETLGFSALILLYRRAPRFSVLSTLETLVCPFLGETLEGDDSFGAVPLAALTSSSPFQPLSYVRSASSSFHAFFIISAKYSSLSMLMLMLL